MRRLVDAARWVGRRAWFPVIGSRVAPPIDRALFRLSPKWLTAPGRRMFPTLMLLNTGRKTGRIHTTPLLYLVEGDAYAVVASNWGKPRHPAWSSNLLAQPAAEILVGEDQIPIRARRADGTEFDRLWNRFVEMWPAFADYRMKAGRDLRMFVLEPL